MAQGLNWSVVSFVDEPAPLLAAFVAHYLDLGAQEIHLAFDRPRPQAQALLAGNARVRITVLDRDLWLARGRKRRPIFFATRQSLAVTHDYLASGADWCLHVDADEYLVPDSDIGAQLARARDDIINMRVQAWERVVPRVLTDMGTIFAGDFKRPGILSPQDVATIWDLQRVTVRPNGFHGHALGKSFLRGRRALRVGPHFAVPEEMAEDTDAGRAWFDAEHGEFAGKLLHFNGMTVFHWLVKFLTRVVDVDGKRSGYAFVMNADRPAVWQMVEALLRDGDPGPLFDLALAVQCLTPAQEAALAAAKALEPVMSDIAGRARAAFPTSEPDFSPEAFDAALVRERSADFARLGMDLGALAQDFRAYLGARQVSSAGS